MIKRRPLRYRIIHGFSGGRLLSRGLRKRLEACGFHEAESIDNADIVIAHSGGFWLLNSAPKAKIIMLIAPALPKDKPSKAYKAANLGMWKTAAQNNYLLKRSLWSLCGAGYLAAQPRRNRKIVRLVIKGDESFRPPQVTQTIIIANREDPWPKSKMMQRFIDDEPWAFLSLPGSHEHFKEDPASYVAIIDHYARLLAQANDR